MKKFSGLILALLLAGCGTIKPAAKPADPTLVQLTGSAAQAFELGAFERAARFYDLALQRARATDDSVEIGRNAYNLAACRIKLGQYDEAGPLLLEAKSEFERNRMDVSSVLLLQAAAAKGRGDVDGARALLAEVLKGGSAKPASRLQAYLVMTDLACDAGNTADADLNLSRAKRMEDSVSDDALRGGVARISGRVFVLKKKPALAAPEFDREASLLQRARRYREMPDALERAGAAWLDAGDAAAAADRFYRAARSSYAQGDLVAALKSVDRAMTAAQQGHDKDRVAGIAALLADINEAVKSSAVQIDTKAP